MAWERRGRGRYFYRSVWTAGRVVKQYYGGGVLGELAASVDAESRQRRAAEAEALRADRARFLPAESALRALDGACDLLAGAALTAAGYHRPGHNPWRRRRG